MATTIHDYVKSLNFSYKGGLRAANVKYFNGYASFGKDANTLEWRGKKNKSGVVTAEKILIASGGRPYMGEWPGKELCINSDDIFWLKEKPGPKVCVIGASYIALECAGFMHGMGLDVTVMVRGKLMRLFDQQCAQQIGELMERKGVRFLLPASPVAFRKANAPEVPAEAVETKDGNRVLEADGVKKIYHSFGGVEILEEGKAPRWEHLKGPVVMDYKFNDSDKTATEQFDAVFVAIGRTACAAELGLDRVGVTVHKGKIVVDETERTSQANIYAIGDVATGLPMLWDKCDPATMDPTPRPELTPVAIQAGQYLARRLAGKSSVLMPYHHIATTVFTPDEYGFVGLSEDEAVRSPEQGGIGADNVEVFVSRFGTLEVSPSHPHLVKPRSTCFLNKNQWAYKVALANKHWWPAVLYPDDCGVEVEVDGKWYPGSITGNSQNAEGDYVYDLEYEDVPDGDAELEGVPESRLRRPEQEQMNQAEIFIKANCLAKLVCDKSQNNKVIGFHFVGPNAGEMTQGFALAVSMGATKGQFDELVGIHPTGAEEFCVLEKTRSSGESFLKPAGCGGGSCG